MTFSASLNILLATDSQPTSNHLIFRTLLAAPIALWNLPFCLNFLKCFSIHPSTLPSSQHPTPTSQSVLSIEGIILFLHFIIKLICSFKNIMLRPHQHGGVKIYGICYLSFFNYFSLKLKLSIFS